MGDSRVCDSQAGGVPTSGTDSRWLAVYTRPRHEQKVRQFCEEQGFHVFLPTHRSWRIWSDRRKLLQLPLFPSYVFVRVDQQAHARVMRAPGFLWFVHNSDGPIRVDESELDTIGRLLASGMEFDPLPMVELGDEVEITCGALAGCRGRLISKTPGALALVVSAINGGARVMVPDPAWLRRVRSRTNELAAVRQKARLTLQILASRRR